MAQRHPYQQRPQNQERWDYGRESNRGGGDPRGGERDRYQAGGERRYSSDWDDRNYGRDRGFEGDRSYAGSGYAEETGYRREGSRDERDDYGAQQRGYPYQGSGSSWGGRSQRSEQDRGNFTGERNRGFGDWTASGWDDVADQGGYYGTGHQGGGFGSAAGSRAIGRDPYAPSSSGIDFYGRRSYADEGDRWQSSGGRGGRNYAGRGGQSDYGYGSSQSQYGGTGRYGSEEYGGSRQQSFRGRGPKGYQRTDDRLKELVCECLMEDPDIDASEVTIEVSGAVVTLTGTVDDRRAKYRIEEAAESVGGIKDINNQLRVQQSAWQSQSGSQGQSSGIGSEASASGRGGSERSSSSTGTGGALSGSSGSQTTGSSSKRN